MSAQITQNCHITGITALGCLTECATALVMPVLHDVTLDSFPTTPNEGPVVHSRQYLLRYHSIISEDLMAPKFKVEFLQVFRASERMRRKISAGTASPIALKVRKYAFTGALTKQRLHPRCDTGASTYTMFKGHGSRSWDNYAESVYVSIDPQPVTASLIGNPVYFRYQPLEITAKARGGLNTVIVGGVELGAEAGRAPGKTGAEFHALNLSASPGVPEYPEHRHFSHSR
ncbi:hypothetical protein DFH08DRAFT_807197 [Mycena albidolilacea]|uniref:Uncharacterized protein n=1 Tax=Mycena albidolilacea TaxID=1033008 RepID=A0AAD7ETL2_9AGAR|nr:hypothetical protein DFH08DRAFT_807197 [Mycena albidolilacea]